MQSEFACHIGLRGKFFCRACWVKGHDAVGEKGKEPSEVVNEDSGSEASNGSGGATASEAGSEASELEPEGSLGQKTKGRRKKVKETLSNLVRRAKDFVKVCTFLYDVVFTETAADRQASPKSRDSGDTGCNV